MPSSEINGKRGVKSREKLVQMAIGMLKDSGEHDRIVKAVAAEAEAAVEAEVGSSENSTNIINELRDVSGTVAAMYVI